jgi:hypothetical protein
MMSRTKKSAVSEAAANWAAQPAALNRSRCATCGCSDKATAFIAEVVGMMARGQTTRSLLELHAHLVAEFSYPYSSAALRNHAGRCLGYWPAQAKRRETR